MAVWGVDIGTRSWAAASLDGDAHTVACYHVEKSDRRSELRELSTNFASKLRPGDVVFIEEPPYVNSKRIFMQLAQTAGALAAHCPCPTYFVPVTSWKLGTTGHGSASKSAVAFWLWDVFPDYSSVCGEDQNKVDATCIALYGRDVSLSATLLTGTDSPRSLGTAD